MESANATIQNPPNQVDLKWVRTNNLQSPYDYGGQPRGKPYRLYSKWHLLHSIRAGKRGKWYGSDTEEFCLSYDGYTFETPGVEIQENPKSGKGFCDSCLNTYNALKFSISVGS